MSNLEVVKNVYKTTTKNVLSEEQKNKIRFGTQYRFIVEPCDIPIDGMFDSGDSEQDQQDEQSIHDQLNNGNEWAWANVRCIAEWRGVEESYHTIAASYKDRHDFETSQEAQWLRNEALALLIDTIADLQV